jgi:opacity protein-like surface antigen
MKRLLTAGALALAIASPAQAEMLYPQRFRHDFETIAGKGYAAPYFKCDYSTHTCESGYAAGDFTRRVFVLLDGDNQRTVLGHFVCAWQVNYAKCFNYDTGEWREMFRGYWQTKEWARDAGDCNAAAIDWFGSLQCP